MLRCFVVNASWAALIAYPALWLWNAVCLKPAINPVNPGWDYMTMNVGLWTVAAVNLTPARNVAYHVECAAKA